MGLRIRNSQGCPMTGTLKHNCWGFSSKCVEFGVSLRGLVDVSNRSHTMELPSSKEKFHSEVTHWELFAYR